MISSTVIRKLSSPFPEILVKLVCEYIKVASQFSQRKPCKITSIIVLRVPDVHAARHKSAYTNATRLQCVKHR